MHPDALCLSKVYSLSFHVEGDIIYLAHKKSLLFDRKLLTSVQFHRDDSSHQEANRNLYLYALCFFKSKPSYIKGHWLTRTREVLSIFILTHYCLLNMLYNYNANQSKMDNRNYISNKDSAELYKNKVMELKCNVFCYSFMNFFLIWFQWVFSFSLRWNCQQGSVGCLKSHDKTFN